MSNVFTFPWCTRRPFYSSQSPPLHVFALVLVCFTVHCSFIFLVHDSFTASRISKATESLTGLTLPFFLPLSLCLSFLFFFLFTNIIKILQTADVHDVTVLLFSPSFAFLSLFCFSFFSGWIGDSIHKGQTELHKSDTTILTTQAKTSCYLLPCHIN